MMRAIVWGMMLLITVLALGCEQRVDIQLYTYQDEGDKLLNQKDVAREMALKHDRLLAFLSANDLRGFLINRNENYAWITAGLGNNRIEFDKEGGAVSLLFLDDGSKYVLCNGSEAARVMEEKLGPHDFRLLQFPWYETNEGRDVRAGMIAELAEGGTIGADVHYPGTVMMYGQFKPLRYRLTEGEITRYRWLGRNTAEAVEQVCRALEPGMSEYEMEAMTAQALRARGITPTVLLMGVDERLYNYRHALPTDAELREYGMVNVCAERWGLTVAVTRFVHFGPLSEELEMRLLACAEVNARYEEATHVGEPMAEIFEEMKQWYDEVGFQGEWMKHHQGGAIGYDNREFIITPGVPGMVLNNQAFAWNPTITGAKIEDTILAREDGVEILTQTADWPTIDIELNGRIYPQPAILVR